jgi:hypothetical protein
VSTRTPTLAEVIKTALDARLADVHVSLPARVQRYDPSKQLIDAKPLIMGRYLDENEQEQTVSWPVITNVPVAFPGAGGLAITFPVAVGDTVWLLFSERSLDTWLTLGGEVAEVDFRDHSINDAICILGARPFSAPLKTTDPAAITIGLDGGAFQGVALGPPTRAEFDALWNAVYGHVHPITGVQAGPAAVTSGPATGSPAKQTVTSATVKVTP